MCITTKHAYMQDTYLLVLATWKHTRLSRKLIYQNEASTTETTAMVLPIPSVEITGKNVSSCEKNYLSDMYEKIEEAYQEREGWVPKGLSRDSSSKVISTRCGSYDVHIVNNLTKKSYEAINFMGIGMSDDMYNWYKENYKGWSFAICVFNPDAEQEKHPICFEYETFEQYADWLHYPLVDEHSGNVPQSKKMTPHQIMLYEDGNGILIREESKKISSFQFKTSRSTTNNEDLWIHTQVAKNEDKEVSMRYHSGFLATYKKGHVHAFLPKRFEQKILGE